MSARVNYWSCPCTFSVLIRKQIMKKYFDDIHNNVSKIRNVNKIMKCGSSSKGTDTKRCDWDWHLDHIPALIKPFSVSHWNSHCLFTLVNNDSGLKNNYLVRMTASLWRMNKKLADSFSVRSQFKAEIHPVTFKSWRTLPIYWNYPSGRYFVGMTKRN